PLARVEPHDEHAGGAHEIHQPIERRLDRLHRAFRPSRSAASYCPAGRPQLFVVVARWYPSRCRSTITSALFAPVAMMRATFEQHAREMIGWTMRSPAAVI